MNDAEAQSRAKYIAWWGSIAGICLIIITGSIFVTRAYLMRRGYEMENWRPPHIARLERDLDAVNRDGQKVSLSQLRGKIYVAGHQYTDCPAGCLGTAAVMVGLEEEFGDDPRFRLVSISVNPTGDTPEKMDQWLREKGIDSSDWWFLTGDPDEIRKYMISQFKFYATEEITDPAQRAAQGPYAHDQRLVIVDGEANIRGYYDVMNVQVGSYEIARLRRDLKMILDPTLKLTDLPPLQPDPAP
jgi:cytochrome oxidase Cu insertion factor (SCO1/SenC/PrrC family)